MFVDPHILGQRQIKFMFNYNSSTHPNDVKSVRTNDRRTEPDLFIWRLFVEDVCSVMGQFDSQHRQPGSCHHRQETRSLQ